MTPVGLTVDEDRFGLRAFQAHLRSISFGLLGRGRSLVLCEVDPRTVLKSKKSMDTHARTSRSGGSLSVEQRDADAEDQHRLVVRIGSCQRQPTPANLAEFSTPAAVPCAQGEDVSLEETQGLIAFDSQTFSCQVDNDSWNGILDRQVVDGDSLLPTFVRNPVEGVGIRFAFARLQLRHSITVA